MSVPKGPRFKKIAAALDAECARLGRPLRPGAAEMMLEQRVEEVALVMNISGASAFRYIDDDWPIGIAAGIVASMEGAEAEGQGPPVVVPTLVAAQLVAALGQAAIFASVNVEHVDAAECLAVVRAAGEAQTALGAAIRVGAEEGSHEAGMPVATVARVGLTNAQTALSVFAARLNDGSWKSCWCGLDDLDHPDLDQLAEQVESDRHLVEQIFLAEGL